jgi:hypothetical protein
VPRLGNGFAVTQTKEGSELETNELTMSAVLVEVSKAAPGGTLHMATTVSENPKASPLSQVDET